MNDLKEKAIRGGFAKMCSQAVSLVLRVGSLMAFARLLNPEDFGLVGMVTAVIGVLYIFREFGLSAATVQRSVVTEEQISTLFWINIAIGSTLALVCCAMAPVLARFYHEPRLLTVTMAMGTAFVANAAGVQHSALLQREMRFTALAVSDTVGLSVSIAGGLAMALTGYGFWALVAMTVIAPLVTTCCMWLSTGWIPKMPRRGVGVRSMLRFGGTVTLNGLVVYAAYNVEKVLMGRFWGAGTVGVYGRAYQLITLPNDSLYSAIAGVAVAALSRLQNDPERLKSYFLKSYSVVLALGVAATMCCAIFAADLVFVLLGQKWTEAAGVFQLLAPAALVLACINPMYWLLLSLGRIERSLKIGLVIAPLVVTAYFIGFQFGPRGVALSYSVVLTLWMFPHIAWAVYGTPVSFREVVVTIGRPLLCGCVAALCALGAQRFYGELLSPLLRVITGSGVFCGVYVGMLWYTMGQKALYRDVARGMRMGSAGTKILVLD